MCTNCKKVGPDWEQTGSYGTPSRPVVVDPETGEERIAILYFIDENGAPLVECCNSSGCDYCDCPCEGCRHNEDNAGRDTAYFVFDN